MALGRHRREISICIFVLLACQIWSGAAYRNQQSKWLTKHMSRFEGTRVVSRPDRGPDRHLQESSMTSTAGKIGYRASLVDEDHKLHTQYNFSPVERISHSAERSRSRAWGLDSRARAAPYYSGKAGILGRKTLQVGTPSSFEAAVEATPGSYSMAFSIGTPPQNFVAIADTGSDLVWIQCAGCTLCYPQSSPLFQPGNSSTYTPLGCSATCNALGSYLLQCTPNCKYSYGYGDQSTTEGDYSADTVSLGNFNGTSTTHIPDFKFGCGLQNNGTFTSTDGIVGLARGSFSFPSQIAPYLNNATKFSYCLVSKFENATVTSPIIFGEAAVPTNVSGVVYTPILSPYNVSVVPYYYVNLQGISVGVVNVTINPSSAFQIDANGNGGTIFDSGTTYTQLTSAAYSAVVNEFMLQMTNYPLVDLSKLVGFTVCYDITGLATVQIPSLVFHFENADFDLPFENMMEVFSDNGSSYMCLALMESPGLTIFGSTQQQNFQVVYEEDALQIGWLPFDCKTL